MIENVLIVLAGIFILSLMTAAYGMIMEQPVREYQTCKTYSQQIRTGKRKN